ncbi:MAG: ATP-binding protein [Bacteroidales bacterium]|nr:ATP-binding protein [Bacteroidales bacterium]
MKYYQRLVDEYLIEWKNTTRRMPLLVRGARQVGKSTAIRELGKTFKYYVEINLERQQSLKALFTEDIDVRKTCANLSAVLSVPIVAGETLLFIDEIQSCQTAIRALRYFKEDFPELHVIAAGSLLEFALEELPSFAVGRIRSLYMYPFSFDEFVKAQGLDLQVESKNAASSKEPLVAPIHIRLKEHLRNFYLVGGMPAAVAEWIESNDFTAVRRIHNDILDTYQDDFSKYNKRVSPVILRMVLMAVAQQSGCKFVYAQVSHDIHSSNIKEALSLLSLAGLATPVTYTAANGVPLGAEEDIRYRKYLFLDTGLMLTMQGIPAADILLSDETDLVNKGPLSEIFAGLELMKYGDCFVKPALYYWQHQSKNGNAEVDYLTTRNGYVLPVEVKANTKGSMQSLYLFMRKRHLTNAVRTSLENFTRFDHVDSQDNQSVRRIEVIPLYALKTLSSIK